MTPEQRARYEQLLRSVATRFAQLNRAAPAAELRYDLLAAAAYWSDEVPIGADDGADCSVIKPVMRHRSLVMLDLPPDCQEAWDIALSLFPGWIGFSEARCAPPPEVREKVRLLLARGDRETRLVSRLIVRPPIDA